MKIFGVKVPFTKEPRSLTPVSTNGWWGWWGSIRESFTGAWQQNITIDSQENILAFSAVFACVTMIAADMGKMRMMLMRFNVSTDIWDELSLLSNGLTKKMTATLRLLKKPNRFQTRIKFIEQWIVSKLLNGNTYILKQRNADGDVDALYVLDPSRVTPLVAKDGSVWYRLGADNLSQVDEAMIKDAVPASEIIHDTMVCLFHPLCGVSPIYACGMAATMGNKIQNNSAGFFGNASRPSGILTAPGEISDVTAKRLKDNWEANFSGTKSGKVAVLGDGLKYEAMVMTAVDAQLIEQLKWSVEDVARAFHMPMFKLGGAVPSNLNIEALQQVYYSDCLQSHIESQELSLDEGLDLPDGLGTELDLENLLRMDSSSRFERINKAIAGGWIAPNEGRLAENYPPAVGGDSPMMQQQNWSLAQLAQRQAPKDAPSVAPPPAAAANINVSFSKESIPEEEEGIGRLGDIISHHLQQEIPT